MNKKRITQGERVFDIPTQTVKVQASWSFGRYGLQPVRTAGAGRAALAAEVMSRPKHRIKAAGAYFVTTKTWQERKLFQKDDWAKIVIETMLNYRRKGNYRLHTFVVMPDHFHIILTPSRDCSLEKAAQLIKGGSSHRLGKKFQIRFPVWQKGFHEHWIRSQDDYETRKRYIEQNPVKAKLATQPADYPFSSANGSFELDPFTMTSGAKAPEIGEPVAAGLKPRPAKTCGVK